MLRVSIFITGLLLIIYSCNNDISSVGQDLINNNNYIGEDNLTVNTVGTVKVDSFATSCGRYATSYINKLVMGRYDDPEYCGLTTAIPCFQVIPSYVPSISSEAVLDSLTLRFNYAGNMWGDTLYDVKLQTFHLYQLKDLPELNYEDNWLFYNTEEVELDKEIGTTIFYPLVENIRKSYFKIDRALADDLFNKMVYREGKDDDIYDDGGTEVPYITFLKYFRGLAIVPDDNNDCLMTIHAMSDSLYLQFDYTEAGTGKSVKFPLGQREYQYNRIVTKPVDNLKVLEDPLKEVAFDEIHYTVVQGLSGYMTKMALPQPPGYPQYTTIIRAQLELKPEIYHDIAISLPSTLNVYTTNDLNEITGFLADKNNNAVTGRLVKDETNIGNSKYIFDLTEYYQKLSNAPALTQDPQILLSVPNDGLSSTGVSFDRMLLFEKPIIKIHYANYK